MVLAGSWEPEFEVMEREYGCLVAMVKFLWAGDIRLGMWLGRVDTRTLIRAVRSAVVLVSQCCAEYGFQLELSIRAQC